MTGQLHGWNPGAVIEAICGRGGRRGGGKATAGMATGDMAIGDMAIGDMAIGDMAPGGGRRLALVIEGGGMRSVCSAGGALALASLGLHGVFDEVIATSAGVMNASYLLSNQPALGISIYFEECTSRQFLNPWRFWKPLDVDFIVDVVAGYRKPLDLGTLLGNRSRFLIAMCDRSSAGTVLCDAGSADEGVLEVLRAAMALPVAYNRCVPVGGRSYIDAGTLVPFPLDEVIERGATDILVLTTRPIGFRERPPTGWQQAVFAARHAGFRTPLSIAYAQRHERSQLVRDMATGRRPVPRGVNVATICTDADEAVSTFTTDPALTQAAAVRYGRKILEIFGEDPGGLPLGLPGTSVRTF